MQGLSVGAITGAATAGLVELEPTGDRRRAALLSVLAQGGGSAAGPLVAGALAQWAPDPRVLCYLLGVGLTATAAIAAALIPDPAPADGRWRIQRPSVPPAIRTRFARASVTGAAVWAVAALFLSVVPSYAAKLLDTNDLALLGAIAATMLATSCATQLLASGRVAAPVAQPVGLGLLTCGLLALVLAFPLHSLPVVLAAAVLAGMGHGLGFLGAQTEVNQLAPAERRGEVTAAFMSCIYGGVAISVIAVGLASTSVSLSTAVACFAAALGSTAVLTAGWHLAR